MIELDDRRITERGISIVKSTSSLVSRFLRKGALFRVDDYTKDITEYNKFAPVGISKPVPSDFERIEPKFEIPEPYRSINIVDLIWDRLEQDAAKNQATAFLREQIAAEEITWLTKRNMMGLLNMMHYIVSTLEQHNVPWGVGRGSSVNSYVLFLLGVHDVDPIRYGLNWREFLRDQPLIGEQHSAETE